MPSDIPEPWNAFLKDLEQGLDEAVELHCLGGFVVAMCYGLEERPTADVDVLMVKPFAAKVDLIQRAGRDSVLHKRHGVYLQIVTVLGSYPEDYDKRLTEMFPGVLVRLRLFALDPYDLALTKLERNIQRDRDDVYHLADTTPFDLSILRTRYEQEMRPSLGNPRREDLTMQLWIDAIEERRQEKG